LAAASVTAVDGFLELTLLSARCLAESRSQFKKGSSCWRNVTEIL